MLPIVLIGDSQTRMKQIESSLPTQMPAPLRALEISTESAAMMPLPALTTASIIVLDVNDSFSTNVAQYVSRLHMAYPDSAVLVLLPFGDAVGEEIAINSGADEVHVKPLTPHRMALSMRNLSELVQLRYAAGGRGDRISLSSRVPVGNMAIGLLGSNGHVKKFHQLEQEIIRSTIAFFDGHVSKASRALGIGRSTLYRKIDAEALAQLSRQRTDNVVAIREA